MAARKATKPMTAETGEAVVNVSYFDERIDKLKSEIIISFREALKAHAETEAEAITGLWRAIHWRDAVFVGSIGLIGVIISITTGMLSLSGCSQQVSPPQQTAIALNATYRAEATATANAVYAPTPEYDPTLTPTASETLRATDIPRSTGTSSIITATPRPSTTPVDHIIEVDTQEVEWLSALCWIEGRGYGESRATLCASAVSTVFERTRRRELSAGTVYSTLTWDCRPDSETCQFPAWSVFGCKGILPTVCPDNDPDGLLYFQGVVLGYLAETIKPQCANYLYYDNSPTEDTPCIIKGPNGQREGFYNK